MYSAFDVLDQLKNAGVTVGVEGDNLTLYPGDRVPTDLIPVIREAKADIIRHIQHAGPFSAVALSWPMTHEQNVEVARLVLEESWRYLTAKRHVLEA